MAGLEFRQVLPFIQCFGGALEDEFQPILNFPAALCSGRLSEAGIGFEAGDHAVLRQEPGTARTARRGTAVDLSSGHEVRIDLIAAEVRSVEEVECL